MMSVASTTLATASTAGADDASECCVCNQPIVERAANNKCSLCEHIVFCKSCMPHVAQLVCCGARVCEWCIAKNMFDCENCAEMRCAECLLGGCKVDGCNRLICDNCLRDCSECNEQFCCFHLHKVRLIGQLKSVYVCAECFEADCACGHIHEPSAPTPSPPPPPAAPIASTQ